MRNTLLGKVLFVATIAAVLWTGGCGSVAPKSLPSPQGSPQISVVPTSVSFGNVPVGTTNSQTITVLNPGNANLSVSQATASGSGFGLGGLALPMTVAPGGSAVFNVSFSPSASNNTTGTVTLTSNAPTSPTSLSLSGNGVAASLQLTASPTSLSYGNVNVGSSGSKSVTLNNTGNSSVSISQIAVTGAGFSTSGLTAPLSLAAGQSATLTVIFAPSTAGSVSGNVSVTTDATNSLIQIALSGTAVQPVAGPLPAFPGAQGGGALSVGGRGGTVYEVTNLNDSGTGSFRACVEASGPRTCVFRTGGTIVLQSSLHILNPFITIAGQTAPGGGIQLANSSSNSGDLLRVGTHDVIVRFIRGRIQSPMSGTPSPFSILNENANIYNVMFDHSSAAWAAWDNFDFWMGSFNSNYFYDVTVQWSILGEPNFATNGGCSVQISGASSAISDQITDIDFHHNFLTGANHRNPIHRVNSGRIINNLVYNASYYDIKAGGNKDIIGNYIKAGPYTSGSLHEIQTWTAVSIGTTAPPSLYIAGNAGDSNGFNPAANQWSGSLTGMAPGEDNSDTVSSPIPTTYQRATPLATVGLPITVHSAGDLATSNGVLLPDFPTSLGNPGVGASAKLSDTACDGSWVSNRDSLDNRYVSEFLNNTGHGGDITTSGTSPTLASGSPCASSLHDGIADQWKTNHGLSITDATLYQQTAPNGYTYLENYLNGTDPNVIPSLN
jgi:pectate lyase